MMWKYVFILSTYIVFFNNTIANLGVILAF